MLLPPAYKLDVQARIPAALAALHNFIKTHEPDDQPLTDGDNTGGYQDGLDPENIPDQELEQLEGGTMGAKRDAIALAMWVDYQRVLQERGFLDDGGNSEESSNNSNEGDGFGDDDDDDMFDGDSMLSRQAFNSAEVKRPNSFEASSAEAGLAHPIKGANGRAGKRSGSMSFDKQ